MFTAMNDLRTRRLIRRIIAGCGVYQSAFRTRANVLPEERIAFNAAQREIGLWLQEEAMLAHPEGYLRMNSEAAAQKALERDE